MTLKETIHTDQIEHEHSRFSGMNIVQKSIIVIRSTPAVFLIKMSLAVDVADKALWREHERVLCLKCTCTHCTCVCM